MPPTTTTPAHALANATSRWVNPSVRPQRIVIISEDLAGNPDEGAKKATLALAEQLRGAHDVVLISTQGPCADPNVCWIPTSKTFLGRDLARAVRAHQPDVILYATLKSTTLFSFLRARLLRAWCPGAQIVLFGWQTRRHPRWQQVLIRRLRPDLVFAQSEDNCTYLRGLGCHSVVLPSGVDTERFHPADDARCEYLRARHGLRTDRPVVLHVGHLNQNRGVRVLSELARASECQPVLVASTSSPQEHALAAELRAVGVTIFDTFLPYIEELYQLADCYIFPVVSSDNAIESPLSVFEALACDLPVVSTRFAGLPALFGDNHPGLTFVDSLPELAARADTIARTPRDLRPNARALVLSHSWGAMATQVMEHVQALPDKRHGRRQALTGVMPG